MHLCQCDVLLGEFQLEFECCVLSIITLSDYRQWHYIVSAFKLLPTWRIMEKLFCKSGLKIMIHLFFILGINTDSRRLLLTWDVTVDLINIWYSCWSLKDPIIQGHLSNSEDGWPQSGEIWSLMRHPCPDCFHISRKAVTIQYTQNVQY